MPLFRMPLKKMGYNRFHETELRTGRVHEDAARLDPDFSQRLNAHDGVLVTLKELKEILRGDKAFKETEDGFEVRDVSEVLDDPSFIRFDSQSLAHKEDELKFLAIELDSLQYQTKFSSLKYHPSHMGTDDEVKRFAGEFERVKEARRVHRTNTGNTGRDRANEPKKLHAQEYALISVIYKRLSLRLALNASKIDQFNQSESDEAAQASKRLTQEQAKLQAALKLIESRQLELVTKNRLDAAFDFYSFKRRTVNLVKDIYCPEFDKILKQADALLNELNTAKRDSNILDDIDHGILDEFQRDLTAIKDSTDPTKRTFNTTVTEEFPALYSLVKRMQIIFEAAVDRELEQATRQSTSTRPASGSFGSQDDFGEFSRAPQPQLSKSKSSPNLFRLANEAARHSSGFSAADKILMNADDKLKDYVEKKDKTGFKAFFGRSDERIIEAKDMRAKLKAIAVLEDPEEKKKQAVAFLRQLNENKTKLDAESQDPKKRNWFARTFAKIKLLVTAEVILADLELLAKKDAKLHKIVEEAKTPAVPVAHLSLELGTK